MKKLQQFAVLSITYDRLERANFNLSISFDEAIKNDEIIKLADSESLRAIRRITNHPYDEDKLKALEDTKDVVINQKSGKKNKRLIKELNDSINKMLYIPEYVCLTTENKTKFPKIGKNGFKINNEQYIRLLCGSGHARTNKTMFVKQSIYKELNAILKNGCKNIKMIWQKYNAYYALTNSSTFCVPQPRVCVVADKEIKMVKNVDWTTENDYQDIITNCDKELVFNLWDGMGIISPTFAKKWKLHLNCDYLPSAFIIRCAFIKGAVVVFDFHKFAKEIANKQTITDIYGVTYDINDIDVILTQSQFKLWNAYDNWQSYLSNLEKSGISWGVSKVTPKEEKDFIRTNYQFLQVLNLEDKDIEDLCTPTINWLKGVSCEDLDKTILYLLGKLAKENNLKKIWNNINDNFIKCLLLDNRLINDKYIKMRIINSLNKKIKESYIGKLLINGNFQIICADPYAFCEYVFGMEIKGLLKEKEHHSGYWNKFNKTKVAGLRAPLTWQSEVNILNLVNNELTQEWYQYLDHCIIYNVWGVDMMIHAGADYDGDIVMTTSNEQIIKGAFGGVPVTYQPVKAEKLEIDEDKLYQMDSLSYDTPIGFITNVATTFREMITMFDKGSKEYNEIEIREKLCCVEQSKTIDAAKGVKVKKFPKHWTTYKNPEYVREKMLEEFKNTSIEEMCNMYYVDKSKFDISSPNVKNDIIDFVVDRQKFNNSIIVEKRPYFMRYLYPTYNTKYKKFLNDFDRYCKLTWGKSLETVLQEGFESKERIEFINYYNFKNPLLETNGTMNRICRFMTNKLANFGKHVTYSDEILDILFNKDIEIKSDNLKLFVEIYNQYNNFKLNRLLSQSDFNTYEQFYKYLRNYCLTEIDSSLLECTNYAVYICYKLFPNKAKDFVWDVFGNGVVKYLKSKNNLIEIPILDDNGSIDYLYQKFERTKINV